MIAFVQDSEKPVDAQDALEEVASIKAHAIECLSVASSYQSLSELEDFFKPGELALTRWSRPNVVPSDILNNPIFEGDELNAVVEEEREHEEPLAPAGSDVVGPCVGRFATGSPEPEQPAELVQEGARPEGAFHLADSSASTCPSDTTTAIASNPAAATTASAAGNVSAPVANTNTPASDIANVAFLTIPASIERVAEVTGAPGSGETSVSEPHLEPPAQPPTAESVARSEPVESMASEASAVATPPEVEITQPAECSLSGSTGAVAAPKPAAEEAIEAASAAAHAALPINMATSGAPSAVIAPAIDVAVLAAIGTAAMVAVVPTVETPAAGTDAKDVSNASTAARVHVAMGREMASALSGAEAPVVATTDATATSAPSVDSIVDGATAATGADPLFAGYVQTAKTPQLPPTLGLSEMQPVADTLVPSATKAAPGDADEAPAAPVVEDTAPVATEPKASVAAALSSEVNHAEDSAARQEAAAEAVSAMDRSIVAHHEAMKAQTGTANAVDPRNKSTNEGEVIVAEIVATAMRRAVAAAETAKRVSASEVETFNDTKISPVASVPVPVALPSTPVLDAADRLKSHRVLDADMYFSEEEELTTARKTPPLASRTGTADTVEYSPGGDSLGDTARSTVKAQKSLLVDTVGGEAAVGKTIGETAASGADATAGSEAPSSPAGTVGEASGGSVDPAKAVTATATVNGKDSLAATTNPVKKSKTKQKDAAARVKTGFLSCFTCFGGSSAQ
ncbi:hypothetical protein Vretimale_3179 [Volvox reticuliferus]|uniref:Uncharacterized protein n=1 Tax=Volvox reticuliferus TaxID=1737510 RepID=A0A8J4D898_9CHLO|nr:hypothetical protein Vretimale_3179 [Volvox reticuliferus]